MVSIIRLAVSYHATMRLPSTADRRPVGANMTPMIDVVFLLIIFFLVSSHLARQEIHLPLDLPVASTFRPLDPERTALTITVDTNADWRVKGSVVDLQQLRTAMSEYRQREGREAAVRIRTDGAIQYQFVEPVLREAARAGITDAAISVREQVSG